MRSIPLAALAHSIWIGSLLGIWGALVIANASGAIEPCMPFWDGCASISKVGRSWPAIVWFKVVSVACIVCLVLFWMRTAEQLKRGGLAVLGLIAGGFLLIYIIALGIDGTLYRWMRRFGIYFFFVGLLIAQCWTTRLLHRRGCGSRSLNACAIGILAVGFSALPAFALVEDDDWLENLFEWWLALLMYGWFGLLARTLPWDDMPAGCDTHDAHDAHD
ncbi:MAG: hypothetical protein ISN29_09365 [Gammaproteobacteria bacterium AqS3]|nr:hypothetical protein [Gammaproteobacteria bacterium AqS3]